MALSRWEASLRPAHARRFRDHLGTDLVRSNLPPLCVPVSASPVSREASRDFEALDRPLDNSRVYTCDLRCERIHCVRKYH